MSLGKEAGRGLALFAGSMATGVLGDWLFMDVTHRYAYSWPEFLTHVEFGREQVVSFCSSLIFWIAAPRVAHLAKRGPEKVRH